MGTLNKVTSKICNRSLLFFFNKSSIIKDYPVSNVFFDLGRIRDKVNTVAFFGGSQGAVANK